MSDKENSAHALAPMLNNIAESLVEIGETLESLLSLFQEREEGFKNRAKSFDRKPPFRKSYDRDEGGDDEGGFERKPYRKPYERDAGPRKSYGDKPSFGAKKPYAKKTFGDKKPAGPRAGAAKKSYKGGY
jgi:hypothetical protein